MRNRDDCIPEGFPCYVKFFVPHRRAVHPLLNALRSNFGKPQPFVVFRVVDVE